MPGSTPHYALPYPVPTDLVIDVDDAIKALAERLVLVLPQGQNVVVLTDAGGVAIINYPFPYPVGVNPIVVASGGNGEQLSVTPLSNTQFQVQAWSATGVLLASQNIRVIYAAFPSS